MPAKYPPIKVYPNPEQHKELRADAARVGLSLSEYMLRLSLAQRPPPPIDKHVAIRDLVKINGDLARLGNLLKMAIEGRQASSAGMDLMTLFGRIRETQATLKAKIEEL
ncbi:conjugal transfer protein TraJ [Ferrovibrio sp.]|uniref:plasmid mobilization protein n=1 Tax=Ferrovibrio sp. TaxID=1917215 RepID=UPI00311E8910